MSETGPDAADLAAFLRDVTEATTTRQSTFESQTSDGFAAWLEEVTQGEGIRSPYLDRPDTAASTLLQVSLPGPEPVAPQHFSDDAWQLLPKQQKEQHNAALARHSEEHQAWQQHKDLYDDLFGARTPPEHSELVFATGLLVAKGDPHPLRRHLVTAPAEVELDRASQALRVTIVDSARLEINWTDTNTRTTLGDAIEPLRDLQDAQSYDDTVRAAKSVRASFGRRGVDISTHSDRIGADEVGLGANPALLLRKRDSSSLLKLLREMAADMADGGHVSEPFQMIVSPTHHPEKKSIETARAALPLPANEEQREMIDNARREPHLVLQGPPGTGKTHTIANLAAVLMAEGRRVLITADNERALGEVQSKLPEDMQPLMLPMLRDRGTGPLQASVNTLSGRASRTSSQEKRQRDEQGAVSKLEKLEESIAIAERRLIAIADEDRRNRTFGELTIPTSGHQIVLAGTSDKLALIDSFLTESGSVLPAEAADLVKLTDVVKDTHRSLAKNRFPEGLMLASDLAVWLQDHRKDLSILGDPGDFDHSELSSIVDDLALLASMLQELPPTPWTSITRTSEDYTLAGSAAADVAADIDHSVTLDRPQARSEAIALCDEYLALDSTRFDEPFAELIKRQEKASRHAESSDILGNFDNYHRAKELIRDCEAAIEVLRRDRSGLLDRHVTNHRVHGNSSVDTLIDEARDLIDGSRDPVGLEVTIGDGAPALHLLERQARMLLEHLVEGGKMTGIVRPPKVIREVKDLITHVHVGGSVVDNEEEAARAAEYLRFRRQLELIDLWAGKNALTRPAQTPYHDWLSAVIEVPALSEQVQSACKLVGDLITFPFGSAPDQPEALLTAALATVSKELSETLAGLAAAAPLAPAISIMGLPIRNRAEASRARAAIRAVSVRSIQHEVLPESWANQCNPVDVEDRDHLVELLKVCSAAAAVPGRARTAELVPSSVNRVAERAQVDQRRSDLKDDHERVIGGLQRTLAACVPQSPATQAISAALADENPTTYRQALQALEQEVEMADQAVRLEAVRDAVKRAHPALLAEFDVGDQNAVAVLSEIAEFERLRDHRNAVRGWKDEIGSADQVHLQLRQLHREVRQSEHKLASLRCWGKAIDRLQNRRELRSSLSALSNAMDAVPKTRTAKSYPARMRALRQATTAAAPAIPCWVMTIDRVAEILGYPTGEDRFDVVIVDESSQAWFPAIFLYAIAEQVIIVGDKLQTSPSKVLDAEKMRSIAREHIFGHRLEDRVGDDLSLYDVAEVMTGPDMMVDHFRCVPEIIDISNRLSYAPMGRSLKASRVREPGALNPVELVEVLGHRPGQSAANVEEIKAIVQQVVACHADPEYRDMDFGVVVVGPNSSAHLKRLRAGLIDALGPQAMRDRNLEVGTASQFQGAERHVMFLSLVVAPAVGERIRIWPHEHTGRNRRNVQQLNVAVSRARDQLWIFHSFTPTQLAPNDARAILLETPPTEPPALSVQLEACDSKFERDVVNALAGADPHLTIMTQVEALGYSIDIVVQDQHGNRLAVECDGDRWHSSDTQIRNDLYRQRTLESIGWRFHRFLASEWYDDPQQYVKEILTELIRSDPSDLPLRAEADGNNSPAAASDVQDTFAADIDSEVEKQPEDADADLISRPAPDQPDENNSESAEGLEVAPRPSDATYRIAKGRPIKDSREAESIPRDESIAEAVVCSVCMHGSTRRKPAVCDDCVEGAVAVTVNQAADICGVTTGAIISDLAHGMFPHAKGNRGDWNSWTIPVDELIRIAHKRHT